MSSNLYKWLTSYLLGLLSIASVLYHYVYWSSFSIDFSTVIEFQNILFSFIYNSGMVLIYAIIVGTMGVYNENRGRFPFGGAEKVHTKTDLQIIRIILVVFSILLCSTLLYLGGAYMIVNVAIVVSAFVAVILNNFQFLNEEIPNDLLRRNLIVSSCVIIIAAPAAGYQNAYRLQNSWKSAKHIVVTRVQQQPNSSEFITKDSCLLVGQNSEFTFLWYPKIKKTIQIRNNEITQVEHSK